MGQRADVPRFSMCNCLTVRWPRTYTAHGLTIEAFCRHAAAGRSWAPPRAGLWPGGYVRLFRFPARVRTFLFSPFNEAFHPSYVLDGERVAIGPHPDCAGLRALAKPVPRYSPEEYIGRLRQMAAAVDRVWAPGLKVLVLYDCTRAGVETRKRVRMYDELARLTLRWPTIRVVDPDSSQKRWCHFDPRAHAAAQAELAMLEDAAGVSA